MGEQSKQAGIETDHSLRIAEDHLTQAERTSKQTGDKTLVEKVIKIKEAVVETRKEIKKNLEQ
jgi:hypothetical protein